MPKNQFTFLILFACLLFGFLPEAGLSKNISQSLGWRGKRVDETGLIYLGARQYDPQAGRFISADPLGINGSLDLYSFAQADPANFFDPSEVNPTRQPKHA